MIDLHLHLDGSLSPEFVIKTSKLQKIELPTFDIKKLKEYLSVPKTCKNLNDYLECFDLPLLVLQTKEAISEAFYDLQERLKKQGLIYAEIRFAPQLHTRKGLSQEDIVKSAIEGLNRSDFFANIILCCMRGDNNEKENLETVLLAKKYLDKGVCAIDLAGAEAIYSTEKFKNIFEKARKLNVPFTIHAGEADSAKSVKTAIDFGAKRIGHGINSFYDKKLLADLIESQIPLEVCPTSNLQTKVVGKIKDYPIRQLFEQGVKLTINTDNMTVSNTTISDEYKFLINEFGFSKEDILVLINNSIDVAFIDEIKKQKLRDLLKTKLKDFIK